ncbi:MAG: hypothetical protein ACK56F_24075, partial [bacterium]
RSRGSCCAEGARDRITPDERGDARHASAARAPCAQQGRKIEAIGRARAVEVAHAAATPVREQCREILAADHAVAVHVTGASEDAVAVGVEPHRVLRGQARGVADLEHDLERVRIGAASERRDDGRC